MSGPTKTKPQFQYIRSLYKLYTLTSSSSWSRPDVGDRRPPGLHLSGASVTAAPIRWSGWGTKDDIQLLDHHRTHCGFCSPGFIMSANRLGHISVTFSSLQHLFCSLMKNNKSPSEKCIERGLLGNICRCTGYRSILDAMKYFSHEITFEVKDIKDLSDWVNVCPMSSCSAPAVCKKIEQNDKIWLTPKNMAFLFDFMNTLSEDKDFKLVAGNTGNILEND